MINFLRGCYLLLIIINTVHISHQDCPKGWFGSACNMLCNCIGNCNPNGDCGPNSDCKINFFGPSCQYVDIVTWDLSLDVPGYLRDNVAASCNPDPNARSVEVKLSNPLFFTWFRMRVKEHVQIQQFIITFNSQDTCWNEKRFIVDNKTIDVMCDNRAHMKSLQIYGTVSPSICTINISGGRKLSLKQGTGQTSTLRYKDVFMYGSNKAVDNDPMTCATTEALDVNPQWMIMFMMPSRLTLITVSNIDAFRRRLDGARMILTNNQDQLNTSVLLKAEYPADRVYLQRNVPIVQITIMRSLKYPNESLSLCEVSAYGDPVCPDLMYGLDCNQTCNCTATEACNYITGACTQGCSAGLYGINCTSRCSPFCENVTCHYYNGSCYPCLDDHIGEKCEGVCVPGTYGDVLPCITCSLGCIETCDKKNGTCTCKNGYHGSHCDECVPGTYGAPLNCTTCSSGCIDTCDIVNGTCLCTINYHGPRCDECVHGWYGTLCSTTCSEFCLHNVCNMFSGECTLCIQNRTGRFCEVCPDTFYGNNCNLTCPEQCQNGSCHKTYGTCYRCNEGYHGKMCLRAKSDTQWSWLLMLMCIPLMALVLTCKHKKQDSPESVQDETISQNTSVTQDFDIHKQSTMKQNADIRKHSTVI